MRRPWKRTMLAIAALLCGAGVLCVSAQAAVYGQRLSAAREFPLENAATEPRVISAAASKAADAGRAGFGSVAPSTAYDEHEIDLTSRISPDCRVGEEAALARLQEEVHEKRASLLGSVGAEHGKLKELLYASRLDRTAIWATNGRLQALESELLALDIDALGRLDLICTKGHLDALYRWHRDATQMP